MGKWIGSIKIVALEHVRVAPLIGVLVPTMLAENDLAIRVSGLGHGWASVPRWHIHGGGPGTIQAVATGEYLWAKHPCRAPGVATHTWQLTFHDEGVVVEATWRVDGTLYGFASGNIFRSEPGVGIEATINIVMHGLNVRESPQTLVNQV